MLKLWWRCIVRISILYLSQRRVSHIWFNHFFLFLLYSLLDPKNTYRVKFTVCIIVSFVTVLITFENMIIVRNQNERDFFLICLDNLFWAGSSPYLFFKLAYLFNKLAFQNVIQMISSLSDEYHPVCSSDFLWITRFFAHLVVSWFHSTNNKQHVCLHMNVLNERIWNRRSMTRFVCKQSALTLPISKAEIIFRRQLAQR